MAMSSASSSTSPAAPAKRACDSCHRRKVKCLPIGEEVKPCRNCVNAGLECTFYNKVQKKGPKGSRAKVLSEIRETQKLISPRPLYEHSSTSNSESRSSSPTIFERTPGLITSDLLDACVEYYFKNLYASQPILSLPSILRAISSMNHSIESYCKMTSICAYVLLQPQHLLPPTLHHIREYSHRSNHSLAQLLLEEAIRVRKGHEWSEVPNLLTIYTSYFFSRCHHSLDKQDSAWIYLRQAMTVAHVLGLQNEETYARGDPLENFTKRKLFWALFTTERTYAIKLHRPLSLYPTIHVPNSEEEPEGLMPIHGFIQLVKLYRPFDDKFFSLWNRNSGDEVSAHWFEQLRSHLDSPAALAYDASEVVAIDLHISRQWLRCIMWRLSVNNHMPSLGLDSGTIYKHLTSFCREVVNQCSATSHTAMEVNGLGLAEKIFDIACTLADYMTYIPFELNIEARDTLQALFGIMASLSSSQPRLLMALQAKAMQHLPNLSVTGFHSNNMSINSSMQQQMLDYDMLRTQPLAVHTNVQTPMAHTQAQLYDSMISQVTSGGYGFSPFGSQSTHQVAVSNAADPDMLLPYRFAR